MKKLIFTILLLILISAQEKIPAEILNIKTKSFKNPEAAIKFFVENLTQNNLAKALEACDINESSENYNFKKFSNRLRAIILTHTLAPSEYPMYVSINKIQRTFAIMNQVKYFCYNILSAEKVDGRTIVIKSDKRITNFIDSANPVKLKELILVDTSFPRPNLQNKKRLIDNFKKQAKIFGAIDKTERIVLYQFKKNYYLGGFSLLLYKDGWKIHSIGSDLANISALGVVKRTTIEEYNRIKSQ